MDMSPDFGMCFTAESARLIDSGAKTQTRRVLTAGNSRIDGHKLRTPLGYPLKEFWGLLDWESAYVDQGPSPAGNTGQYLHVPFPKEGTVHRIYPDYPREGDVFYVKQALTDSSGKGRSARYMPRSAATIFCRVTRVRLERVQALTQEDAQAEGFDVDRCEKTFARIAKGMELRAHAWLEPDENCADYCRKCAESMTLEAGQEVRCYGFMANESDGPAFCEKCGYPLLMSLTEYGINSQLYLEDGPDHEDWAVHDPREASVFHMIADGLGDFRTQEQNGRLCQIAFATEWDRINPGRPWACNPWVVVREFERVKTDGH